MAVFENGFVNEDSVLNWVRGPRYKEYQLIGVAYQNAAKALVDRWPGGSPATDFDVYPIVFLYRHAVELLCKSCILCGQQFLGLGIPNDEAALKNHDLANLVPSVRAVYVRMGWVDNADSGLSLDELENRIRSLNMVDQKSFAFRYPEDKSGSDILGRHFTFDLLRFSGAVEPVCESLNGAICGVEDPWPPLEE